MGLFCAAGSTPSGIEPSPRASSATLAQTLPLRRQSSRTFGLSRRNFRRATLAVTLQCNLPGRGALSLTGQHQQSLISVRKHVRKLLSYSPARHSPRHWRKAFCKRCETCTETAYLFRRFLALSSRQDGPWRGSNVKVSSRVAERTAKLSSVLRLRVNLGLSSPRRKKARSVAGLEVVPKFGAIYAGSGQWRVLVGHPQRRASAAPAPQRGP